MSDVATTSRRRSKKRKFYEVIVGPIGMRAIEEYDWAGGVRLRGQMGPFTPPFMAERRGGALELGSGFADDVSPAILIWEPARQKALRDFEQYGDYWLVSARALEILKHHAAASIHTMIVPLRIRSSSGTEDGPPHWFCDVVRFEDCIDEAASKISWDKWGGLPIYSAFGSQLVVRDDLPDDAHLFRLARSPGTIVCTDELMRALKSEKLTGVRFNQLDKIP